MRVIVEMDVLKREVVVLEFDEEKTDEEIEFWAASRLKTLHKRNVGDGWTNTRITRLPS